VLCVPPAVGIPCRSGQQRQRIRSCHQREGDALAAEAVRFENGADHLDGGAGGVDIAERRAVVADSGEQVAYGQLMAADLLGEVGDRFRLAGAGRGDRHPCEWLLLRM